MSVKDLEGGRSGRCPPVACDGAREQAKVRNDFVKGRERARVAWSAEAWSGSQRGSIGCFGGRYMGQERRAQAGQSSMWERAGLRVQCSSARAGGAPPIMTAPAARSWRRSAAAALLAKWLRNQFTKLLFLPPSPASSHMLAPEGRRTCTLAGGTQEARPERKERPARMQKSRF